jgi:rhamnosyltransferase
MSPRDGAAQIMTNHITSAVVVTFRPRREYLENLAELDRQFDLLIVVDNGSTGDALIDVRAASRELGFRLIENRTNLGIATALNTGVREALQSGCNWVALFDQDSSLTEGFAEAMLADFEACAQHHKIMQIVPRYRDPESGLETAPKLYQDGGPFLTITSGSFFPKEAFETCGLFMDDLFIYCVDDDYSLRVRAQGFYIGQSKNAVLLHHSGNPSYKKVFGFTFTAKNYRPEARYYYARNKVWILRNYGSRFPRLIVPTLREFLTIPLKIALAEETPWIKIKMFLRGLLDGVKGRMGRLPDPAFSMDESRTLADASQR